MLDAEALIFKHQGKGVLVDANLLVLLLVGTVNKERIPKFKRTKNFESEDFEMLLGLIRWFGDRLVATPHVLSQVSDLTDLEGEEFQEVRRLFSKLVGTVQETYEPSEKIVKDSLFVRLGLADAAIAMVGSTGVLVLTADVTLQLALQARGIDALNFNHIRSLRLF